MLSFRALVLGAAITGLAACGGSSGSQRTGDISLGLTDAPVDHLERVQLTINAVGLKPAQPGEIRLDLDEPLVVDDLLALQNGSFQAVLPTTEVPAGRYNWIRLYVQAGTDHTYVVDDQGGQHPLYLPGQQSGNDQERHLQLVSGFQVPVDGEINLMLDVDLRRAITRPQSGNHYLLRPAMRLLDLSETGTIIGSVADALITAEECTADPNTGAGNVVYLYEGSDRTPGDIHVDEQGEPLSPDSPLATANVRQDAGIWQFTLDFVPAGDYTVAFSCQGLDDDPQQEDDIVFADSVNVSVAVEEESVVSFE
ncbi:DUF4382 domain-containing protein [Isoalcanivorax indicus]|uniref:DUF4382 domain-containing protein n=1 Tax=Isoalcanivorax indicus TaxID=2202653 RepID=UPI0013C41FB5|nr:DUF4382 domain-containing protein [Isoalcanivorax indicus]